MPKLILTDVDRTIAMETGKITDSSIFNAIQTMQEKGWIIGVNSDTSFNRLNYIKQKFGFNGPIICERGNAVYLGRRDLALYENYPVANQIAKIRLALIHLIQKFADDDITVTIVRKKEDFDTLNEVRTAAPQIIMFDIREYGFAFTLAFDYQGADPRIHPLFKKFVQAINSFLKRNDCENLIVETYDYADFIQIFDHKSLKGSVIPELLQYYQCQKTYMIGDSGFDNLRHPQVIQLGVGNAFPDYRPACQFISEKEFSQGFIDCLNWIETNHK